MGETDWNASAILNYTCTGSSSRKCFSINVSGGVVTIASQARNIVFGSLGVSALMAIAAILDIVLGMPFGGQMTWDIMLILAAALVIYMGTDCLKEIR